jgi:2-methylisocitrate lyase-like PEP mutase family enzyme
MSTDECGSTQARTVTEYHRTGIAALHIEDQVSAKRCGHLDSKQLVDTTDFLARIAAATQARDRLPGESCDKILIIARTDALAVSGMQDALDRMKKAKEMGADIGFVEGMTNDQEAMLAVQTLSFDGWPLLLNHVTGGKSPVSVIVRYVSRYKSLTTSFC